MIYVLVGLILLFLTLFLVERKRYQRDSNFYRESLEYKNKELKQKESDYDSLKIRFDELGLSEVEQVQKRLSLLNGEIEKLQINKQELQNTLEELQDLKDEDEQKFLELEKKIENQKIKFKKNRDLYTAMASAVKDFYTASLEGTGFKPLSDEDMKYMDSIAPSVILSLKSMNYKDLRKKFLNNQKQIEEVLTQFTNRYATKTTRSLYQVMVIALKAELQNILTKLKYSKLEEGIQSVQEVINKYISIAESGNLTISGTVKQFAYTIENLFMDAVNIEYEYYIKKEQERQEQLAIKAKMREEREERRRLAEENKRFDAEKEKFNQEQIKLQQDYANAITEEEKKTIEDAIKKIDEKLVEIEKKKEEIVKLQHGKAGNVYIISNLGSFGDHIFKIGMTRRLDPQERVDELGSVSVPFEFDVHSFIFSEDASDLETELHRRLNEKRVNKINKRKEFFDVTLDELEKLVNEISPTSEFKRTMLAEEYRQSLSLSTNAFDDFEIKDNQAEDDEDEELRA